MPLIDTVLAACTDIEELRTGGQRSAFRALHATFGSVVVKHSTYRSNSTLQRLSREASYLESVDSPGIPKLFQLLVDPGTKECVTVEQYVPSRELEACRGEFTSEGDIVRLVRSLVSCLKPVWRDRVVHRDLKPTNILIANDGHPWVVDFGIARFLDESSLTQSSAWMGPATPVYAAPEQLRNRKDLIDARTDFFALGIIALELRLQVHPFSTEVVGGDSIPENIIVGSYAPPESKPGTSEHFSRLVRRLLQVEPFLRYPSADAIEDFLDQHWENDDEALPPDRA